MPLMVSFGDDLLASGLGSSTCHTLSLGITQVVSMLPITDRKTSVRTFL